MDVAATILVADDDPAIRVLLTRLLQMQGYEVVTAQDGREALALLRTHHVDIVLSDWVMPGMDGVQLCGAIKGDAQLSSLYVILLTSNSSPGDIATGLDAGADDYLAKPCQPVELAARIRSGLRVRRLQKDLARRNRELADLASTDTLTGIRNRYALESALAAAVEQHQRWHKPLSILLLDLDGFKAINDEMGHPMGDALLRAFAEAARGQVRRTDLFGRLGGDEFMLILPETGFTGATTCAERIRAATLSLALEGEFPTLDQPVTVSIGIATWLPQESLDESQLIDAADKALYSAKRQGGNCVAGVKLSAKKAESTTTKQPESTTPTTAGAS